MEFNSKKLFKANSSDLAFLSYYSMKKNPLISDTIEPRYLKLATLSRNSLSRANGESISS